MSKVEIILVEAHRESARRALNLGPGSPFRGPTFEDAEITIADGCAVVMPRNDTVRYFYPLHTVSRIKETPCADI